MFRKLVLLASAAAVACTSPTAPAPIQTSPTAIVVIKSFSVGAEPTLGGLVYNTRFVVAEMSGNVGVTLNSPFTFTTTDGSQFTVPVSWAVAAGQQVASPVYRFLDASGRPPTSQMTLTIGYVDAELHTGTVSMVTTVVPIEVFLST
jgi:hypothetical protein